jgi:hypothetical protein
LGDAAALFLSVGEEFISGGFGFVVVEAEFFTSSVFSRRCNGKQLRDAR